MEWQDEGIVLSIARHGESDAVIEVMTENHGRARGFVKGGLGRRNRANLQAGNLLSLTWRSRIEANLGRFTLELLHSPLGHMIGDGARLSALAAITAVVASTMPERAPFLKVYKGLCALVNLLENEDGTLSLWGAALARLELGILTELGYGLDLSECAASGVRDNLTYVSPKSGRAVCADAGAPYSDKLLPLPAFLLSRDGLMPNMTDAYNSLKLTGYFLERNIWIVSGKGQPAARERLLSALYTASR
ncbi:DNA repair protein RecO [Kordiimonas pumila]|uniref:DNA repair protein RecO n=1 Tax=Kordiimonas pumila TaxID=2161677 RepID=A0ABV7D178_9PROT|nr:DNA repair protein RecO [Kordiimonas pumila]